MNNPRFLDQGAVLLYGLSPASVTLLTDLLPRAAGSAQVLGAMQACDGSLLEGNAVRYAECLIVRQPGALRANPRTLRAAA